MGKEEVSAKKAPIKLIAVIGIALVAVIAVIFFLMPKEEAYRQVQVYKVEGTADVERQPVGILEAYDNMMLQNQDIVNVSEKSNMQVKLDEDKYILLEPKTRIHLEATGTSEDSKTKIFLEEGAIVCNIENPLSENSTYEVNTPNSTMAVRGTTFRVALEFDEAGDSYTATAVFEGKVESYLVYPDGSVSEESVAIEKGTQVQIKGTNEDSMYIVTDQKVTYEEFKSVTLEFLNVLIEKGEELSVDKEALEEFIEQAVEQEALEENESLENSGDTEEDTEEDVKSEDAESADSEMENSQEDESSESYKAESSENSEETEAEDTTDTGSTVTPTPTPAKTYTVTFTYNGETFATQTVTNGKCATEPKLMPTAAGEWDFDFTQKITANTTIEWIDNSGSTEE